MQTIEAYKLALYTFIGHTKAGFVLCATARLERPESLTPDDALGAFMGPHKDEAVHPNVESALAAIGPFAARLRSRSGMEVFDDHPQVVQVAELRMPWRSSLLE